MWAWINDSKKEIAERFGITHFINPGEIEGDLVPYTMDLTKGSADESFEFIGKTPLMRQALECAHTGFGEAIGIAGAVGRSQVRGLVHAGQDRDRPDDHTS